MITCLHMRVCAVPDGVGAPNVYVVAHGLGQTEEPLSV